MRLNLPVKDLASWLSYISQLHPKEMDLGLDRVSVVATRLKCNQFVCPVVTITGTNGKGSCVKFLEEIYSAGGYRVGAFTSPHLMTFNERVRINNQLISDKKLVDAFAEVEEARQEITLSFFEFTFLAALQIFRSAKLDLLLLEVGLGGRLDAVNIIDTDVAIVTTIDLDHTEWLGPDRSAIAREKAGIFRFSKPVVCGDPEPPAILKETALKLGCPWYAIGENFIYSSTSQANPWNWQNDQINMQNLPAINLKHQNAATSLMAVELLQEKVPITENIIREGLAKAKLCGRFEKVVVDGVTCYLDVAHNPQGGRWLAEQVKALQQKSPIVAVFSMLGDKDIAGTATSLLDYVKTWYLSELPVSRAASLDQLQEQLGSLGVVNSHRFANIPLTMNAAIEMAQKMNSVLLVFGSFYTVAQARQYLIDRGCL